MKKLRERCGSTLLEVVVSIALLGLLVVPISSGIITALRINEKSDDMMQARLAVSSAAETVMAVGIEHVNDTFEGVALSVPVFEDGCRTLTVQSEEFPEIFVEISVRSEELRTSEVSLP